MFLCFNRWPAWTRQCDNFVIRRTAHDFFDHHIGWNVHAWKAIIGWESCAACIHACIFLLCLAVNEAMCNQSILFVFFIFYCICLLNFLWGIFDQDSKCNLCGFHQIAFVDFGAGSADPEWSPRFYYLPKKHVFFLLREFCCIKVPPKKGIIRHS